MARQVSEGRKVAFYLGTIIMIIGLLMFLSVFITGAMHFGDFSNFSANARSSMFRALGGMVLIVIGNIIRMIGSMGLAGSGVILDPEKAKEELEPYSRMAGGMTKDFLEEADIKIGGKTEKVIMLKCQECGKLNEHDSKFCQECGKQL